jgi:type III pantothenate kinase
MTQPAQGRPLVTIDVGNSRTKLGLFAGASQHSLPLPERMLSWGPDWQTAKLDAWLGASPKGFDWWIASVNRAGLDRIATWLASHGAPRPRVLGTHDFSIPIRVDEPDAVGVDRLANTLAAGRLKRQGEPAIVVALGTAITVDLVSPDGAFAGGAILPGIAMSAHALHELTDLLPLEPMWELGNSPPALGKTTSECLQAGIYWGVIGGIRELIDRLGTGNGRPQVFVTGGAAPAAVELLARPGEPRATLVPHLTLAGIALTSPG